MKVKHFTLQVGSHIFKALSDESRLRVLYLLYQNKQMCTSDLESVLGYTQAKVSRHLMYLKNAGMVHAQKREKWTFYSIKKEVQELIDFIFLYFRKDVDLQKDMEIYSVLYSNRELAINRLEQKQQRDRFYSP